MKLKYHGQGGIAGADVHYELDTNNRRHMSEEQSRQCIHLVQACKFFELKDAVANVADKVKFTLAVERDGQTHTVSFETGTYRDNTALWRLVLSIEEIGKSLDAEVQKNIQKFLETAEGEMSVVVNVEDDD